MARKQVIVQLDDDLVAKLDRAARREGVSRSELIRRGARALIEGGNEVEAVRRLVDAYSRIPQDQWIVDAGEDMAAETTPSQ
jgi:metal-responsive CopG/Arc/MetJ family transcriptional regulator